MAIQNIRWVVTADDVKEHTHFSRIVQLQMSQSCMNYYGS